MTWLILATVVQFVFLLALGVVVLSLARQVGILHERTAPAALVGKSTAIAVGDRLAATEVRMLSGQTHTIGEHIQSDAPVGTEITALLFIGSDCPICRSVLPVYQRELASRTGLSGFWVGDGLQMGSYEDYAAEHGIDEDAFVMSTELGLKLGVRTLPAVAFLDSDGKLISKEVVNGPRQLEKAFSVLT